MENDNNDLVYIAQIRDALASEAISEIDFDRLREWLGELGAILPALLRTREEASLFRDDFKGRIAGMLKAIAIAERGRTSLDEALDTVNHLSDKSAAELIGLYRRTQARFRDTFPSGTGVITPRRARTPRGAVKEKRM